MARIKQLGLDAHPEPLTADGKSMVDKCGSICEWDVPEIVEMASDKLICGALRQALDAVDRSLSNSAAR